MDIPLIYSSQKTEFMIFDIPSEFSHNRVREAIKGYGQIKSLTVNKDTSNRKTAKVTFNNTKFDLDNTWSILINEIMTRIIPTEKSHLIKEHNSIITRLYGIYKN